ncbi:MAG: response regulator transcription factor [Sphingobium sp.]|nr:response regulator transcription factor [Sphingobium sp.]
MRLLIVDDDVELSGMLTEYLAGEGFETEVAHDGEAGVQAALSGRFDALVLDVMMPRLNGIEALRRIRRVSDVPIIMLTARGDNLDRVAGLEMGADDYVAKPYFPLELVARIRAVLRRRPQMERADSAPASPVFSIAGLELHPGARRLSWHGQEIDLTTSEFNVLEALVRVGEEVVSKDDLSLIALGRPREAFDRSLDVHVSNIRQKLSAAGADEALHIETVRGVGYRLSVK